MTNRSQIDALLEKFDAELAKRQRAKHETVVQTMLRSEYQSERRSKTDDQGKTWWRSVDFTEADARASDEVAAMTDAELEEKFDELYDEFWEGASSSDHEGWDEESGFLDGLNTAAGWAREIRDHGIDAFHPDHPRNRQETSQ